MAMKSKKPKIELFALRGVGSLCHYEPEAFNLASADAQPTEKQNNTVVLSRVKDNLDKQNLYINTIRSNVSYINLDEDSMSICCPKLPKDTEARIGVCRQ